MSVIELPERKIQHYGWKRSLGHFGMPVANIGGLKVSPEVDPRDVLAEILNNQWALGSCTSNAVEESLRYDGIIHGRDPGQLSRFQIYWGERKIEHALGQGDTGAEGHDGFVVAQHGLAPETAWPYEWPGMEQDQPPDNSVFDPKSLPKAVVAQSKHYKLTRQVVAVPQNQLAIQAVLSNKQTVAFGFTVYSSFESSEVARTGIVPMPQQGESIVGGHEVLIVGYLKDFPNHALVMNSWGAGWGLKGFFLIPWAYVCDASLSGDLRTIVRPVAS
jgi:C1A family cysteine protease